MSAFLLGIPPAAAVTPTGVVVEDTAGVLDANTLLPAIEDIEFRDPTTVAVYTYNGSGTANLNEDVLSFARAEHPEWLSEDGQKWADGLFIFALDPVGRHIGTYFGEDRKISLDQQEDIREEVTDLFREAQWTDGTIAATEEAAELINQPWYASDGFIGASVVGGVAVLAGAGVGVGVRRHRGAKNTKLLNEADAAYSSVTRDLEATEVNAQTIPSESTYGAKVLEQYRTFRTRYNAATRQNNAAHDLPAKDLRKRSSTAVIEDYADAAMELDGLDDVIADTNSLLNKAHGWERAWDRQVAPFEADLAKLDDLLDSKEGQKDSSTAAALVAFRGRVRQDVQTWAAELSEGSINPETALDRLRDARSELSDLLKNHSETVIAGYAKNDKERDLMREALEKKGARRPGSREGYQPSILDTAFPYYAFYTVGTFNTGLETGTTEISSARGESSSTTGYGSTGGSFSGAGSSGSF
ncbi:MULTISPECIES: DUF5129 domain-containing protein [unclassified Arthrobacter]|uniref:DUF5129 domain-containing protein n=1 Tax=unclassified Arthrobacter TaxID=235627 RepID=UPI001E56EFA6|nr:MULTISPECIES: DUF5129 domain-containing protein [unclassified Arthrobacter]MCC9145992.1 DUF5129 domain-containing protein [Arthrobacter sp. zg-Y919]MDK1277221.1 DUF5129 domain-containing protein [Arthrobacter sp. zg.Y919]WIB03735.1 DUF5129 domain-containing protein [Arthrobacter sp. zg-Y919]